MSRHTKVSKQGSQKHPRSNADTPSTKGMSSGRSASLPEDESPTESLAEREGDDTNSKPSYVVWGDRENANRSTTGDRTTVAGVVADKLFQRAKFVDRSTDLMYDESEGTICNFVATSCNLQPNIDISTWWKQARKWIPTYISRLRNDKSTAMKWAVLGTYQLVLLYRLDESVSNTGIVCFFPNTDWLTKNNKIAVATREDTVVHQYRYGLSEIKKLNERWQQGRKNKKIYTIFFDHFLPCVIKKTVFDRQVSVATNDSTLCTVSDEAFALLLLENSYSRWLDIYQLQKGEVTPKRGQKRREFESDVPTKYTKGGIVYDKTVKNNDPKGWSAEGIQRYNELYDKVKKDRKANKSFTKNWLKKRKDGLLDATQTRKRRRPQPQARIELIDSESEDSGNETGSANICGVNESETELSDHENDRR